MLSYFVICGLVGWFSFSDPTVGWLVGWLLLMSGSVGDHCVFDCWSAVSCCWCFYCFTLAGSQCAPAAFEAHMMPIAHMMSGMSKDVGVCVFAAL